MKIFLENNFICLVTFWKCYFPPPPPQNPPPHNRKTTKTPPPTPPQQQQQNQRSKRESKKSKSQTKFITKISNENENESMRVGSRCEWVRQGSSVRVGSSGFVGACGFVELRRCEWVCGATISLLSLFLSSRMVRKWRDNLDDRWLGSTRVGLNDRSDAIVLLRRQRSSCSFSLSLFYFPRPEIIWSENENGNDFPLFWLSLSVNWKYFSVWPNLK